MKEKKVILSWDEWNELNNNHKHLLENISNKQKEIDDKIKNNLLCKITRIYFSGLGVSEDSESIKWVKYSDEIKQLKKMSIKQFLKWRKSE